MEAVRGCGRAKTACGASARITSAQSVVVLEAIRASAEITPQITRGMAGIAILGTLDALIARDLVPSLN